MHIFFLDRLRFCKTKWRNICLFSCKNINPPYSLAWLPHSPSRNGLVRWLVVEEGGGRDVRIASIGGCGIYKHSTVHKCTVYSKQIYIWQERGTREWIIIILHWIQNGSLSKPLLFYAADSLPCFMWCWPYNIRCCFQVEKMWLLINIYIL